MQPVIWHNPDCGTSRNVLRVLKASGCAPDIVDYRETPPDHAMLARMIAAAGLRVRDAVRRRGTPFDEMGLGAENVSDADLLDAMVTTPILINRPFVRTLRGTALCRPADTVFALIDRGWPRGLTREKGAPFVIAERRAPDAIDLVAALHRAELPIEDLGGANKHFFSYATPDARRAGYAGFELPGDHHALLRSLVVPPTRRGEGLGRTIVPLALRAAHDAGARTAWLLTETAERTFAELGFEAVDRDEAPEAVRSTAEFATLCPDTAVLMRRPITL